MISLYMVLGAITHSPDQFGLLQDQWPGNGFGQHEKGNLILKSRFTYSYRNYENII